MILGLNITEIAALLTIIAIVGGAVVALFNRWQSWRWKDIRSVEEQQSYLEDQLLGSGYSKGTITATVTDVKTEEQSGAVYRVNKFVSATISGRTEVTVKFGTKLPDDIWDTEPFLTFLKEFSDDKIDVVFTDRKPMAGHTLVRFRLDTLDYEVIGSLLPALPTVLWDAAKGPPSKRP